MRWWGSGRISYHAEDRAPSLVSIQCGAKNDNSGTRKFEPSFTLRNFVDFEGEIFECLIYTFAWIDSVCMKLFPVKRWRLSFPPPILTKGGKTACNGVNSQGNVALWWCRNQAFRKCHWNITDGVVGWNARIWFNCLSQILPSAQAIPVNVNVGTQVTKRLRASAMIGNACDINKDPFWTRFYDIGWLVTAQWKIIFPCVGHVLMWPMMEDFSGLLMKTGFKKNAIEMCTAEMSWDVWPKQMIWK